MLVRSDGACGRTKGVDDNVLNDLGASVKALRNIFDALFVCESE